MMYLDIVSRIAHGNRINLQMQILPRKCRIFRLLSELSDFVHAKAFFERLHKLHVGLLHAIVSMH